MGTEGSAAVARVNESTATSREPAGSPMATEKNERFIRDSREATVLFRDAVKRLVLPSAHDDDAPRGLEQRMGDVQQFPRAHEGSGDDCIERLAVIGQAASISLEQGTIVQTQETNRFRQEAAFFPSRFHETHARGGQGDRNRNPGQATAASQVTDFP